MAETEAQLEQRARRLLATEREAERIRRWDMVRTCVECLAACALGLFLIGSALHTTDYKLGQVYFLGGVVVGNAGMLISLARAYLRGEERGDW